MKVERTLVVALWLAGFGVVGMAEETKDDKPSEEVEKLTAQLVKEIDEAKDASDKVKAFAKEKLTSLCTNKVFVKGVKDQNAKKVPLDEIKKIDKEWTDAEDELPIHKEKMNNDVAKELRKIVKDNPAIGESFVMDDQGANVGQNDLTSDYWQGDEPKWQNSFNKGKGGVDIAKPKLDKSTNVTDQKISLPIIDTDGKVIGAVCFGVNPDKL